jgi:hypothetical protein
MVTSATHTPTFQGAVDRIRQDPTSVAAPSAAGTGASIPTSSFTSPRRPVTNPTQRITLPSSARHPQRIIEQLDSESDNDTIIVEDGMIIYQATAQADHASDNASDSHFDRLLREMNAAVDTVLDSAPPAPAPAPRVPERESRVVLAARAVAERRPLQEVPSLGEESRRSESGNGRVSFNDATHMI